MGRRAGGPTETLAIQALRRHHEFGYYRSCTEGSRRPTHNGLTRIRANHARRGEAKSGMADGAVLQVEHYGTELNKRKYDLLEVRS